MATAKQSFFQEDKRPLKLLFQDEARFGRISDPAHCWDPKRLRPVVPTQIIREYTYVFSAVCPHDGESLSLILPYANTEAMKIFLKGCSEHFKGYRLVMIIDKAAWHTSKHIGMYNNIVFRMSI